MSQAKRNSGSANALTDLGAINSIQRPDLVTLVTESIRQRVLAGKYAAGHILPAEAELASSFSVSRNVMREALRNLRSLGLVEVSQGRRPRVKAVDPEASVNALSVMLARCDSFVVHIMALRAPLEMQAVTLAAERGRPQDLVAAARAIQNMKETKDSRELWENDRLFHRCVAQSTGNPFLVTLMDTLAGLVCARLLEAQAELLGGVTKRTIDDHARILEAIQQHDKDAAQEALRRHLEAGIVSLREAEANRQTTPRGPRLGKH